MCSVIKGKVFMAIVSCLLISLTLGGCFYEREYYDDIPIPLENHNAEIIIREWSFLLGSGAEVYYKENNNEILLGKLLGGDDGFCPFKEGLYSVAFENSKLIITWCRSPGSGIAWETKTFDLPSVFANMNFGKGYASYG